MGKQIGTIFGLFALLVALMAHFPPATQAQTLGPSGNPIPRFVSTRADKVHMRTGPGTHYPIEWVYKRQFLPLEVIDEHGPWRKVRDHDGTIGWMHVKLLSGKRFAMVRGRTRTLFAEKDLASPSLVIAEPGVIGELLVCENIWCQMKIQDRKGWIERRHLWGVYKNEDLD